MVRKKKEIGFSKHYLQPEDDVRDDDDSDDVGEVEDESVGAHLVEFKAFRRGRVDASIGNQHAGIDKRRKKSRRDGRPHERIDPSRGNGHC